jgi:hypothetical protein
VTRGPFHDGEVRYKTSLDFEGEALTDKRVIQLVRANLPSWIVIYRRSSPWPSGS